MYFNKFNLTALLVLGAAALMFSSCQKDQIPGPAMDDKDQITLNFTETLPAGTIDSAVVLFTQVGKPDSIYKKMTISGNQAVLKAAHVPAGNWTVQEFVYTKKQADNSYRMYRSATAALQPQATVAGPKGTQWNDTWLPAVMLKDAKYGITVIVAERPEDSYMELRFPANVQNLGGAYIDRVQWKGGKNDGNDYIGMYLSPAALAKGRVYGTTYFKNNADRIKDKPWDEIDYVLLVYPTNVPNSTGEQVLYYAVQKRP